MLASDVVEMAAFCQLRARLRQPRSDTEWAIRIGEMAAANAKLVEESEIFDDSVSEEPAEHFKQDQRNLSYF